jgi:hypothetical protein
LCLKEKLKRDLAEKQSREGEPEEEDDNDDEEDEEDEEEEEDQYESENNKVFDNVVDTADEKANT